MAICLTMRKGLGLNTCSEPSNLCVQHLRAVLGLLSILFFSPTGAGLQDSATAGQLRGQRPSPDHQGAVVGPGAATVLGRRAQGGHGQLPGPGQLIKYALYNTIYTVIQFISHLFYHFIT
jgi:hypothetical protein